MLQAKTQLSVAAVTSSIFTISTKHIRRRSPQTQGSSVTSIQYLLPRTEEESVSLCMRKRRATVTDNRGEGKGVGVEQHMQLASCWELLAKDIASPFNWNAGMDSREWPGLLSQGSHNQEGKAGTPCMVGA